MLRRAGEREGRHRELRFLPHRHGNDGHGEEHREHSQGGTQPLAVPGDTPAGVPVQPPAILDRDLPATSAEDVDRIDARRPTCWDIARCQRNNHQNHRAHSKRQGVSGGHAVQQAIDES